MATSNSSDFVSRYYVVKSSWRGKYKRVFMVGKREVATINPSSGWGITNSWRYGEDFLEINPNPANDHEFSISVKKAPGDKKPTTMSFSINCRARLISDVLQYHIPLSGQPHSETSYHVQKLGTQGQRCGVQLLITSVGVKQVNPNDSSHVLCTYRYCNMSGMGLVEGLDGGFVIYDSGPRKRTHWFVHEHRDQILRAAWEQAKMHVGVAIKKVSTVKMDEFDALRSPSFFLSM